MKKAILMMVLCGAVLASCSKDDGPEQDPMIGTWKKIKSTRTENGQTIERELTNCDKKSMVVFNADGTFENKNYSMDNDECIMNANQGTWKNLGDSVYQSTWGGETFKTKVTFKDNTHSTTSKDVDITYTNVYQKVN